MKALNCASAPPDPKKGSCLCSLLIAVSMICSIYFVGSAFVGKQYKERLNAWKLIEAMQKSDECKDHCRPSGSVALPQGIVNEKSNYKMQPLWGSSLNDDNPQPSASLLAIAVGIKQKEIVDRIVTKFPLSDFVVMLFHYDGVVDKWRDLSWSDSAIHENIEAQRQRKMGGNDGTCLLKGSLAMYMNDLIHAWGLDRKLGHCAQVLPSESKEVDKRPQVRTQSYVEMNIFHKRWEDAVNEDRCWVDPYQQFANQTRY
ncbi:hypothetical protein NC653_007870 [Populus alba x Populus x berolinensis]|uniref:Uncharacterized protein n=1 Tax=Populus alba x Populus x berolinensis TaxID=444605 RepID=A0AAD6W9B1_9ROSI|nr:hypothetical protein NC653_007870 [Populus alba x Populus x berolinensis]